MRRAARFACLAAAAALAGCAQSDSALELANKTNAAALSVKFQIEDFATTQRRVAEIETDRLGRFLEDTIEIETELAEVIADSPSDQATLFSATPTRADEIVAVEAQAAKDAAELRKDLLELLQKFTPPSNDIEALSVQLTVLGAEKSFSENVAFFVSFGTSVKEAIDKAKAERDQALKNAAGGP
jgi:hypothetical protein